MSPEDLGGPQRSRSSVIPRAERDARPLRFLGRLERFGPSEQTKRGLKKLSARSKVYRTEQEEAQRGVSGWNLDSAVESFGFVSTRL